VVGNQGISRRPEFAVTSGSLVIGACRFVGLRFCFPRIEREWRVRVARVCDLAFERSGSRAISLRA
jgi:hypothetical protein